MIIINIIITINEEAEALVMQPAEMEPGRIAKHLNLRARVFNHYVILHPGSTKQGLDLGIFFIYISLFMLSEQTGLPRKF